MYMHSAMTFCFSKVKEGEVGRRGRRRRRQRTRMRRKMGSLSDATKI